MWKSKNQEVGPQTNGMPLSTSTNYSPYYLQTMLARAVAERASAPLFLVKPQLLRGLKGPEASSVAAALVERAQMEVASSQAPFAVFFLWHAFNDDDIDNPSRGDQAFVEDLLVTCKKVPSRILIIASTIFGMGACPPSVLDQLDVICKMDMPTDMERKEILMRYLNKVNHTLSEGDISRVVHEEVSGKEIRARAEVAIMAPVHEQVETRRLQLFERRRAENDQTAYREWNPILRPVTIADFDNTLDTFI